MTAHLYHGTLSTPIGEISLISDGTALTGLYLDGHPQNDATTEDDDILREAREQLSAYFAGALRVFTLPIALVGTPFQLRVWTKLEEIPFGSTISYGEQARRLGCPNASRAVGSANGRNPISIIVPCHRVIGAGGDLTGYGGGLDRKRWLLEHERNVAAGIEAMATAASR